MIDLKKFNKRKKEIDKLKQEKQRDEGALEQLLKQVKKEFNCSTLEEMATKVEEMERACLKKKKKFSEAFAKFEKEYQKFLKSRNGKGSEPTS